MLDLSQYHDKKVIVVRNLSEPNDEGHGSEEVEGKVLSANNEVGLLIKPVGKVMATLIKPSEIEKVELAPTTLRTFKQKVVKEVTLDAVRQHLIDKHGFSLTLINSADENRAMKIHADIDHSDLGHAHGEPKTEA